MMDNPEKIRCALVGYGFMGKTHAMNIASHERAELVAVSSLERDKDAVEALGATFYTDWKEMEAEETLDAVIIATPTFTHADITIPSLERGLHVFLEKPMERTVEKCREILKVAGKCGLKVALGHVLRFDPEYVTLRERVRSGDIGVAKMVRCTRGGSPPGWSSWFYDEELSGTVILDLSIHDIDYICWVAGKLPNKVTAMASLLELDGKKVFGISHVVLDFKKDVAAKFHDVELGFAEATWAGRESYPFSTSVEIAGKDGLITCNMPGNHPLALYRDDGWIADNIYKHDAYYNEIDDFITSILEKREPKVSGEDGLNATRVCLAALESARSGETVQLEEAK
ncbi:MAG: Gfo/Idh/MocA family protein [Promethearchaeota archaeon]